MYNNFNVGISLGLSYLLLLVFVTRPARPSIIMFIAITSIIGTFLAMLNSFNYLPR